MLGGVGSDVIMETIQKKLSKAITSWFTVLRLLSFVSCVICRLKHQAISYFIYVSVWLIENNIVDFLQC